MYSTRIVQYMIWFDWLDFWCFNATFNNISAMSWQPVLVVEEAGVPERTTDHGQATGKLYHLRCESSAPFFVICQAGCEPMPYWW
jgi:hypothetical protein